MSKCLLQEEPFVQEFTVCLSIHIYIHLRAFGGAGMGSEGLSGSQSSAEDADGRCRFEGPPHADRWIYGYMEILPFSNFIQTRYIKEK